MVEVAFAIPGDLRAPTGGYAYDREVLARLPQLGVRARHFPLPGSFPDPTPGDLAETQRLLAALPSDTVIFIDGLAFGAMPADVISTVRAPIVALVHHPLGYEPGLSEQRARELNELEKRALAFARRVVVSSDFTNRLLASEFDVPVDIITVAEPGTDPAERARGTGNPLQILSIGSITPRKGFVFLVEALAGIQDLDWRLTIAGPHDRDPAEVSRLKVVIARHGLEGRIELAGALDRRQVAEAYAAADVFVLPSLFEGFGMVLTEAMARGLPIVCTTGGAAAETVPDEAAIKVPPGEVVRLRKALRRIISDEDLRRQLADAAWAAAQHLTRWETTAQRIANVLREVAS